MVWSAAASWRARKEGRQGQGKTHTRPQQCVTAYLQECVLFPTGFAANLAVAATLADSADVAIFSDELNHASIVDGARLGRRAGAQLHVYRHNDLEHLEALLDRCPSGQLPLSFSTRTQSGQWSLVPCRQHAARFVSPSR